MSPADRDLFQSTAWHYARYRPRYHPAFFTHVVAAFALDGTGRLLDLGCGTGQLTIPLAPYFEQAVGLDPEQEMLAEARRQAESAVIPNVVWVEAGSEDLERLKPLLGTFRLVTIGNAFHWMQRERTLAVLADMLASGGGVVIAADGQAAGPPLPYLQAAHAVLERWLGDPWRARHARSTTATHPVEPHLEIVRRSPFTRIETYRQEYHSIWDIEHIIGYLYSTSFASPAVLGDRRAAIEHDVRTALEALNPDGQFEADVAIEAILAWR